MAGLRARVRDTLWRREADERMEEEFSFHLEMQERKHALSGAAADDAARSARRAFGGVDRHREAMRDGRRVLIAEELWRDMRYAARSLVRTPGFTAISVATIALGIGLTAAMFSILHGILFRGLPFDDADRIAYVSHSIPAQGLTGAGVSHVAYETYVRDQTSFAALGALDLLEPVVSGVGGPERVRAARITSNALSLLNITPALGRSFAETEKEGAVAMISHAMWQRRFEGAADAVGRTLRVDGVPTTVVGVMPEGFSFPERQELWLPLDTDPANQAQLAMFGRLREDVSMAMAQRDLARIAQPGFVSFSSQPGQAAADATVVPRVGPFVDFILGDGPRSLLYTMFGAVLFVLLIACTNVANLLLSRSIVRSREVGIRSALGAGRARVVLQFLCEAALLSIAGATIGIILAGVAIASFNGAIIDFTPAWMAVRLDGTVVSFSIAVAALTALAAGTLPALQAARTDVRSVLGDEGRGMSSFRMGRVSRTLVVFEVALSCGLLVAAGLTTRSIAELRDVDLGFDTDRLFTAQIALPRGTHPDETLQQFYQDVTAELTRAGGFSALSLASSLPGLGDAMSRVAVEGRAYDRPEDQPFVMRSFIGPDYLETLGAAVIEGRDIGPQDRAGSMPVAMVTKQFAQQHYPGVSAVGRRIRPGAGEDAEWRTIIGIMPDIRFGELAGGNESQAVFIPLLQQAERRTLHIIGRTRGAPLAVIPAAREVLARQDLPLLEARTFDGAIARDTWFFSVFGTVFIVFGGAAFIMAIIGLYGVLSFSVGQRTREIGIRVAIGASRRQILAMVMRQGLVQVALGLAGGILLAAGVSSLLALILFGVNPRDPIVFGCVIAAVLCAALLASLIPARRAAGVHPVEALSA